MYDLVDIIKKKRVTHSGLTDSQVVQNRLSLTKKIPLGGENVNYIYLIKKELQKKLKEWIEEGTDYNMECTVLEHKRDCKEKTI